MPSRPPGRASAVADAAPQVLRAPASPHPSDTTAISSSPAARKADRRPTSLEDVLSGRARTPCGFKDFERFLRDKELTVENLHFVVWFRSYSLRFQTLPAHLKLDSPPSSDPVKSLREETRRIAATFIRTGAPKELNLEDRSRERVLHNHAETIHPDAFLPAYEEAYAALETSSLGHFLALAAERSAPRTLLWLSLGVLALLCSVATFLLTVLLLPELPFGWRAVRLASVVFAFAGSTTTYAVARGHLAHFEKQHTSELDPWRLEEDSETAGFDHPTRPEHGHSSSRSVPGLENESKPWPLSLWGNSPAPYRTWKRGHLPPPLAVVFDTACDLLYSAVGSSDDVYLPMPTEDPAPVARASSAAPDAPYDAPAPVRTWKRGHVPPASITPNGEHKSPAIRFAALPSPSKGADQPLPVEEQVFSAAFILDASPPPVSNWGKRGHLPSSAPPPRRSSRAAIVPDWDVLFRPSQQPAPGSKHESPCLPSARRRPSLAWPVALFPAGWHGRLEVAALEVLLVGLVYTACWIALCLAVPSPA